MDNAATEFCKSLSNVDNAATEFCKSLSNVDNAATEFCKSLSNEEEEEYIQACIHTYTQTYITYIHQKIITIILRFNVTNNIQAHRRLKRTLFIKTKHNMQTTIK